MPAYLSSASSITMSGDSKLTVELVKAAKGSLHFSIVFQEHPDPGADALVK